MFSKNFKNFFRRNKRARHEPKRSFHQRREHSSEERSEATYYNCNKSGYIKVECPKLLERYEKKAMATTLSNSDEKSSTSVGEHAHMCFVAHTHEDNVTSSDDDSNSLSYLNVDIRN